MFFKSSDKAVKAISKYLQKKDINNYFPMFICLGFTIISTILSLKFKDVHATKRDENKRLVVTNILHLFKLRKQVIYFRR